MAGEKDAIDALEEDMREWEKFYKKYKFQLDKITEYERRIEDLEKRLAKTKPSGFSKKSEKEQVQIFSITLLFIAATLIFIKIISDSSPRIIFFGGFLIGLGSAGILKMWTI